MGYNGSRRGHGALIIVVLLALAIVLYLMFGMSTGGGSGAGSTSKGGGGSTYMGQVSKTRKQGKAMAQDISTQQLTILLAQYRQENNNKLPKSPTDLADSQSAFKDPWGNELTFSFEDQRGKTVVTYRSKGPDGEANTEDDVSKTDTLPF
jgi:hypothetical protein